MTAAKQTIRQIPEGSQSVYSELDQMLEAADSERDAAYAGALNLAKAKLSGPTLQQWQQEFAKRCGDDQDYQWICGYAACLKERCKEP
jgi:hypothetical protein